MTKSFTHRRNFDIFKRAESLTIALEAFIVGVWPGDSAKIHNAARFGMLAERHLRTAWPKLETELVARFEPGFISLDAFVLFADRGALKVCRDMLAVLKQARNEAQGADERGFELTVMSRDLLDELPGGFGAAILDTLQVES